MRTDRAYPAGSGAHAIRLLAGAVCIAAALSTGCGTISDAPRGAEGLFDIISPRTTPADAALLATDEYSAENRFRGITMLSGATFGGETVYIELYVRGTEDEDPGVRAAAVSALGRHGDTVHAPRLIDALDDDDEGVRLAAARALQRVHNREAIPALTEAIKVAQEDSADVRAAAAAALGQYREPEVVQSLIGALRDPRLLVNDRVQQALLVLTGQNFGLDRSAWLAWYQDTEDLFAGAQLYTYPVFNRDRKIVEYLPFVPPPPNETSSTPVGLNPIGE